MNKPNKVNKDEFLERVTLRLQRELPAEEAGQRGRLFSVPDVYEAMIAETKAIVQAGDRLSLTGFGSYYAQTHKGHPVQFGSQTEKVGDYRVFKFSASNVLNRELRQDTEKK